jgi:MFS superfamily sulfate permease-like transporter
LGRLLLDGRPYNLGVLRSDALAGLTVALVLIPQSMAYAQLAGLPPYYGLYAAFLPPVVAALFGSSRQLATGPVAVVSLMTAASLEPLARAGGEAYIAYAVALALLVGLFQLILGALRLGLVVNFLSHPVVNGFSNAAALIIASSQLASVLGVEVDQAPWHYQTVARVVQTAWHQVHWPTLGMAGLALGIMLALRRLSPRIPYVLVAVVLTTLLSWGLDFHRQQEITLDQMANEQVAGLVRGYNHAMAQVLDLDAQRADLSAKIADQPEDSLARLEVEYELSLLMLSRERHREEAAHSRRVLRSYRFQAKDGPQGDRHVLAQADSGDWRLDMGNGLLNLQALRLVSGGKVVGAVPSGLPSPSLPDISWGLGWQLLPSAAIIALLGFMEAISIAKAMAAKTGQHLDPSRELVGQGLGNLVGSVTGGYPVSGSFSRSAVNLASGARTSLSSLFTSLTVGVVLVLFTPLLHHLPRAVLAAVIILAVLGLINVNGFVHAWRAQRYDGIISLITFGATLAFAPHLDRGIIAGAGLSLLVFLYKSMRPRVASLALGEDGALHDSELHHLSACQHIAVVRFDGPLFYANAGFLEDQITRRRKEMPKLRHVLIVAEGISEMDASGEQSLSLVVDRLRSAGYRISLAGVHANMMAVLERTHLLAKIGPENIYPTAREAIRVIHPEAHREGDEPVCPLLKSCPATPTDTKTAG